MVKKAPHEGPIKKKSSEKHPISAFRNEWMRQKLEILQRRRSEIFALLFPKGKEETRQVKTKGDEAEQALDMSADEIDGSTQ